MIQADINTIYIVVARELIKFFRDRGRFIATMARPLIWLFLVGGGMSRIVSTAMGIPYIQFIFPGIIGMTILFSSIFSSISVIWDKEFGFMKEMLAAPVSRFSIVVGKALSGTAVSVIQAFMIVLLFPLLGLKLSLIQIMQTIGVSMLLAFCLSSLGILIASFYDSFESFSVIMNFIVMPMFFLSGAMYPVQSLPHVLGIFTKINPFTYGIDALKHTVLPGYVLTTHDFPLGLDIAVISFTSIFFVIIAGNVFERKK